ncbi:beta-carotene 15,15'-monooxygenase [Chryseobacterium sp. POL2]|uniref:beta-carotene 15,15'-monooxygenase n=1 Tax=Chryseobacterium sp. POL2 TaxID=2713414 RepID=UPI0013E19218|nr:beta-carotene 15,15'-monooxygenase [Chryseobacterium sp. POL2]QIG90049.1 beta-carotene 15,15'-monooxygenase [Chryseobacterium sp. POL2]
METFNDFDSQGKVPARNTGDIISHAFETYKGVVLYAIVAMILYMIASFLVQGLSGFNSQSMYEEIMANPGGNINYFAIPGLTTYYAFSSLFGLLISPLFLSLIYISHKVNVKEAVSFGDLFYGYKNNLVNILLYSVITGIITTIGFALCILPGLLILPLFFIGYPILIFENASATEALSKSFNIAKENYGTFLGVAFLSAIISIAGIILCGIGIIATAPFYLTAAYSMYIAFTDLPKKIVYNS